MKNLMNIFNLFLAFTIANTAIAQETKNFDSKKKNYIVTTTKVKQLNPIYYGSLDMKAEDGKKYGAFHVVFYGGDIKELTDKELMKPYMEMLNKNGIKLHACGFSMKNAKIDASELVEGIEVVENGLTYSLQLQKKGFYSVEL
jgi:intracellular sulfur oxidation DsrE/DsrF family protein